MFAWLLGKLGVAYTPNPDATSFLLRAQTCRDDDVTVSLAVLDDRESDRYFGVPLARRGIQPVHLRIINRSDKPFRLRLASIDPNYYPPLEAAFASHFGVGKRLLGYGVLAWFFLPLVLLIPAKVIGARWANRRMNEFFESQGIGWGIIRPGTELSGFVFTTLDEGTKQIPIRLQGEEGVKEFAFSVAIPGLRLDHGDKEFDKLYAATDIVECDPAELRKRLQAMPRSTTNHSQSREGDPLNLVVVGDFHTLITGFGARWDETETISVKSCWKTFKAFFLKSSYRYSPVSSLYYAGRSQDFSLQKVRQTINQRLHLRLWMTPLRYQGKPVWIGQISRDIGVRFTLRTWNLTTHKIDPDVDDARDYLLDDLLEASRVSQVGYVSGVGLAESSAPRHNLTGDPYYTDGLRAVAVFSEARTSAKYLRWND